MSIYQKQLKWAKDRGLFLDSRVERKCVDGIWGLFATEHIKAGSKLVSYPVNRAIKNLPDDSYDKDINLPVKNIHKAVLEFAKGESSEYWGHFAGFETLDYLKTVACYFYSADEIQQLNAMNTFLSAFIVEMNELTRLRLDEIMALEPSVDPDLILQVCLNYSSRSWDDSSFLPIIEYANHSDKLGKPRQLRNGEYFIEAKYDYKAGDQIFLSYARKDMYHHATLFNYFDPGGTHYICFGMRFVQIANTPFEKEVLKYTASKYRVEIQEKNKIYYYRFFDPDACFLENGPSLRLIEYLQSNHFISMQEWKSKICSKPSLAGRLLEIIDTLDEANKIEQFKLDEIPEKLHRFFHLLKKEKQMLKANKAWVIDNFYL